MGVRDRLFGALGIATSAALQAAEERASEAYASGYNDGNDDPTEGTLSSFGYRRATTSGLRDWTLVEHQKVLEVAWALYQSSPIAKRGLGIKRDYILGPGIEPISTDEDLKTVLDGFWDVNQLAQRTKEFTHQLYLFGEQCFPAFVRKADGRVKLGYVDPAEVEQVITHPDNVLESWAVVVRSFTPSALPWEKPRDQQVYRIIREEEQPPKATREAISGAFDFERSNQLEPYRDVDEDRDDDTPDFGTSGDFGQDRDQEQEQDLRGKLVTAEQAQLEPWEQEMLKAFNLDRYSGSCFFFKVNSVSNQPRGFPELMQVADWMDQHDVTLFNLANREQLAAYFAWFVKVIGSDEKKVRERAAELQRNPPARGSVNVHNDAEEWTMQHPDVGASNSIETSRALQLMVLGGLGYPEHWFGKGDETNRATAEAQGDPTWKTLIHDQGYVQSMFMRMLQFVADQAEIAGTWHATEGVDDAITLPMPEMTTRDTNNTASMLSQVASACAIAEEQNWQTTADSRRIWAKAISEFGVEIEVEELNEQDQAKAQDKGDGDEVEESGYGWAYLPEPEETVEWAELQEANKRSLVETFLAGLGMRIDEDGVEDFTRFVGELVT